MPTPGTEVVVNLGLADLECSLDKILDALGLTRADLTWNRPSDADLEGHEYDRVR
jgi:hypothetical protein